MIGAGQRLRALAGQDGAAGALLLLIGTGQTAGAALVAYSGLGDAPAWTHLLHDRDAPPPTGGWGAYFEPSRRRARIKRDEELIWMRN